MRSLQIPSDSIQLNKDSFHVSYDDSNCVLVDFENTDVDIKNPNFYKGRIKINIGVWCPIPLLKGHLDLLHSLHILDEASYVFKISRHKHTGQYFIKVEPEIFSGLYASQDVLIEWDMEICNKATLQIELKCQEYPDIFSKFEQLILDGCPDDLRNILLYKKPEGFDEQLFVESLIATVQAYFQEFKNQSLVLSNQDDFLTALLTKKMGVCRHQAILAVLMMSFVFKKNQLERRLFFGSNGFHAFPIVVSKTQWLPVELLYEASGLSLNLQPPPGVFEDANRKKIGWQPVGSDAELEEALRLSIEESQVNQGGAKQRDPVTRTPASEAGTSNLGAADQGDSDAELEEALRLSIEESQVNQGGAKQRDPVTRTPASEAGPSNLGAAYQGDSDAELEEALRLSIEESQVNQAVFETRDPVTRTPALEAGPSNLGAADQVKVKPSLNLRRSLSFFKPKKDKGNETSDLKSSKPSSLSTLKRALSFEKKKKPILLSTGASSCIEVREAVAWIKTLNIPLSIMHCVLNYPTNDANANLNMIKGLKAEYPDLTVGYSDHTMPGEMGNLMIATMMGAQILEKHFTHDKNLPGNDHYHAMDRDDLALFSRNLAESLQVLGGADKIVLDSEEIARQHARRSLVAAVGIPVGTKINSEHLTWKRPGAGISPREIDDVIGRYAVRDIAEDELIAWEHLEKLQ